MEYILKKNSNNFAIKIEYDNITVINDPIILKKNQEIFKSKNTFSALFNNKFPLLHSRIYTFDEQYELYDKIIKKYYELITLYKPISDQFFVHHEIIRKIIKTNHNSVLIVSPNYNYIEPIIFFFEKNSKLKDIKINFKMTPLYGANIENEIQYNKKFIDKFKHNINFSYAENIFDINALFENIGDKYDLICTHYYTRYLSHDNKFINYITDTNYKNNPINIFMLLNNIIIILSKLINGGDAIFTIYYISDDVKQLIEFCTKFFTKIIIYRSELTLQHHHIVSYVLCYGFLENEFQNYTTENILLKLHNAYKNNKIIKNLFNPIKVVDLKLNNSNIYDELNELYLENMNNYVKFINSEKNFKYYLENPSKLENLFKERLQTQTKDCVNWCIKNNVEINPKYLKKVIDVKDKIINKFYTWKPIVIRQFINTKMTMMQIPKINICDKELNPILSKLKDALNIFTTTMESRNVDKWSYVTDQIDLYRKLPKYLNSNFNVGSQFHRPSNAFCKVYEILVTFGLLNSSTTDTIKTFHICEAPGNFIFAFNHAIFSNPKTDTNIKKYDWYINSLNPYNAEIKKIYSGIFKDEYGLMKKYKHRWMFGKDDTGDITNISNLEDFYNKLGRVDIITGDCGLAMDYSVSNLQENILAKINYSQIMAILTLLKNGGSFVIKHFLPMSLPITISYVYLLYNCFDELYFTKPVTSRPSSREIYIVGKGYNKLSGEYIANLLEFLDQFNPDKSLFENSDIDDAFLRQYYDIIDELINKQIDSINRSFYFYDNDKFFYEYKNTLEEIKDLQSKLWAKHYKFTSIQNKFKL
jgi:hypothetical protein